MTSFTLRTAGTIVAASVVAAGLTAGSLSPAAAATTTHTQSETFAFGDMYREAYGGQIQILDGTLQAPRAATPFPASSSEVSGVVGTVTNVALAINGFDHEAPRDVDVMLVAPDGTRSLVMSDVGGASPVNDVNLVLKDDAVSSLNFDDKVASGVYRPSNDSDGDYFPGPAPSATGAATSFAAFDGINPNGTWQLYVVDDLATYTGGIDSWRVYITTGSAFPSTLAVDGVTRPVTDVDVEMRLDHSRLSDLDMLLVGPHGQQVTLLSDAGGLDAIGGGGVNVFDDSATSGVTDPIVYTGRYRPTDVVDPMQPDFYGYSGPVPDGNTKLSVFNGTDVNGVWQLYVADDTDVYSGFVYEWSLRITTADAPAPTTDERHPRVKSTSPGQRDVGVARGATVSAIVDEKLSASSVKGATAYLVRKGSTRHVAAQVSWRARTSRIVIDPRSRLRARTTYVVVVTTRVTDLAGNRLDQNRTRAGLQRMTWRFTTR